MKKEGKPYEKSPDPIFHNTVLHIQLTWTRGHMCMTRLGVLSDKELMELSLSNVVILHTQTPTEECRCTPRTYMYARKILAMYL